MRGLAQQGGALLVALLRRAGQHGRPDALFQPVKYLRLHAGQQTHLQADQYVRNTLDGFACIDQVSRTQRAGGAADAVPQRGFVLAAHLFARLLFRVDDRGRGLNQFIGQLGCGSAQRDLVGNLIKTADRLGAFAVGTAYRASAAAGIAGQLVDAAGGGQHGQMQHDRGAQAGADIGRAGGQVAQPLVIGE